MSEREQLQQELVQWLGSWTTASYGVQTSLKTAPNGRGKARFIAFGNAKAFDAMLIVWSKSALELMSTRHRGRTVRFTDVASFKSYCASEFGAPV